MDIKIPSTKEELEEMRKNLRQQISEDDLDGIVGGNDTEKEKSNLLWTCAWCGTTIQLKFEMDACKHMSKCPKAPWLS